MYKLKWSYKGRIYLHRYCRRIHETFRQTDYSFHNFWRQWKESPNKHKPDTLLFWYGHGFLSIFFGTPHLLKHSLSCISFYILISKILILLERLVLFKNWFTSLLKSLALFSLQVFLLKWTPALLSPVTECTCCKNTTPRGLSNLNSVAQKMSPCQCAVFSLNYCNVWCNSN